MFCRVTSGWFLDSVFKRKSDAWPGIVSCALTMSDKSLAQCCEGASRRHSGEVVGWYRLGFFSSSLWGEIC